MTPFQHIIRTEAELRDILGYPGDIALSKDTGEIDEISRAFIEASPFVLIASTDAQGRVDVSPKGDPAGFMQVLDAHTLLIPDRPGNRRGDTLSNLVQNPGIGLLLLVPGRKDTLRVNGMAQIVRDDAIRARFAVQGKLPLFVIAVTVQEIFFHCTKCVVRSGLWTGVEEPAALPSFGEAIIRHAKMDITVEEANALIREDEETGLY